MSALKCICTEGSTSEDVIKMILSETEVKRLDRIRLSIKINSNQNMIWCPNIECDREIEGAGGTGKVHGMAEVKP